MIRPFFGWALLAFLCTGASAWGTAYDVDLIGMSFHLDRNAAYAKAPRGLDKYGQFVFNPGLGVTVDFRENALTTGFSPVVRGGLFQDCDDRTVFYAGGGIRYSALVNSFLLLGGGFSLLVANGENWTTAQRSFVIVPYPNVEIGAKLSDTNAIRLSIAFAPGGSSISALSASSLLFFTLSFSF